MPLSTSRAINGAKRADAAPSSDQARLLDTVLSCMAQGVCVVDQSLTVSLMNGRFLEMFALPEDYSQPGRPVQDYIEWSISRWTMVAGEWQKLVRDVVQRFRDQPEERFEENWPDGRVIELWRRPLPDGGFVTTYTDVTDHAEAQRELIRARNIADDASRAKSDFLAIMSHELRTPLNAIIGFSEVLSDARFGPLGDPHYTEYANDIRNSGRLLLEVINDILDLVKIDAGRMVLYLEPLDVGALLRSEAEGMRSEMTAAGLTLSCAPAPEPVMAQADRIRLRQIILNLLSNAVKFTPAGGAISVRAVAEVDTVRLEIADTGSGMSDDEIRKALEPFGQLQSALSRSRGGTGLGLTIVKQLTELHDGRLAIDSEKGRGTCVSIALPRDDG